MGGKDNSVGAEPLGATAVLLSDLASQHEHLFEIFTDLRTALMRAEETAGKAKRMVLHGVAESVPRGRASHRSSDAFAEPDPVPEVRHAADADQALGDAKPALASEREGLPATVVPHVKPLQLRVGDVDLPPEPETAEEQAARDQEFRERGVGTQVAPTASLLRRDKALRDAPIPTSIINREHLSARELLEETDVHRHSPSAYRSHRHDGYLHRDSSNHHESTYDGATQGEQPATWELESTGSNWQPLLSQRNGNGDLNSDRSEAGEGMPGFIEKRRSSSEIWTQEMLAHRQNAVFRLQARLGTQNIHGRVLPEDVHKAVTALGLIKYSLGDIKRWLYRLAHVKDDRPMLVKRSSSFWKYFTLRRLSQRMSRKQMIQEVIEDDIFEKGRSMEFEKFCATVLDDEMLALMEEPYQQMSLTIREVLFSGDANRLVAELTHVCVDDVASPVEKPDVVTYLEPVVGFIIFLNGVFIGLQTSQQEAIRGDAWFWGNAAFTVFFVGEILLRGWMDGTMKYFLGADRWWNIFDVILIFMSVFDLMMETFQVGAEASSDVAQLAVMRIMRLTRLARLIRIFRLRYMKELTLMVRGLLSGLQTLFWAVVLLFFTLYVIAILATTTIGRSSEPVPDILKDELFSSLPKAIFTSFRCFLGDCSTTQGKPIVKLLADHYGFPFIIGYLISMMFVTFGLFNLIVAIYIENTLNAAKTEGEKNRIQRQRESVRVARLTRQLLKKFCALQRVWGEPEGGESREVKKILNAAIFDDLGEISMPVSKEMFLCIIQDAGVQKLMDHLDIPPDRASLFDILDADGSGGLEVVELITGLLRVRGEAKKSDIVGCLLAVRAVQDMLREQGDRSAEMEFQIEQLQRSLGIRISKPHCRGTVLRRTATLLNEPFRVLTGC